MGHFCLGGEYNDEEYGENQYDGRGIYLCRTCSKCHQWHMKKYRADILEWYDEDDVYEAINE